MSNDSPIPTSDQVLIAFGRAACEAQLLEEHLRQSCAVSAADSSKFTEPAFRRKHRDVSRFTLGRLRKDWLHQKLVHVTVADFMRTVVEKRNYLMHRFFVENARDLAQGRDLHRFVKELQEIGSML